MKKLLLIVFTVLVLYPTGAESQWHLLHEFSPPVANSFSYIRLSALYFLDLPGPPRIGFAGFEIQCDLDTSQFQGGEVWKTTDGGASWNRMRLLGDRAFSAWGVYEFAFKDSLTGWLAAYGPYGASYKTTDGGTTWKPIASTVGGCYSICYHSTTDRLFMGRAGGSSVSLSSSDEGETWQSLNTNFLGCAFSDDSTGVLAGNGVNYPLLVTTNGGRTWTPTKNDSLIMLLPFGVNGTKIFFAVCDSGSLYRSNDGGKSWILVSRSLVPDYYQIYSLYGDLFHLYTQTTAGVCCSTDQGVSWRSICGPGNFMPGGGNRIGFYQKDSYIYASETNHGNETAKLWVNPVASGTRSRLNISSENRNRFISEPPGGTSTLLLRTPGVFPTGFGADSLSFTMTFDSDVVTHMTDAAAPGWTILTLLNKQGLVRIKLIKLAGTSILPDSVIGWIHFRANLAPRTSTSIALAEVDWDADSSYYDCISASLTSTDSVLLNVTLSCGDSLILASLRHEKLFDIISLRPNPASNYIQIVLTHNIDAPIRAEIFNALGVILKDAELKKGETSINVSDLLSGVYYLRVSQAGFVQTRKVVVER